MTAYLFDNKAYPIVTREEDILPALREPFTRAVTLRDPNLAFDTSGISAQSNPKLAKRYWPDENRGGRRRRAGRKIFERVLEGKDIRCAAIAASITIDRDVAKAFAVRCNAYCEIFTRVVSAYTNVQNVSLRSFVLFTPVGGMGRAQELHVDSTVLTLHWSTALAGLSIANNDPNEELWQALDKRKRLELNDQEREVTIDLLRKAAKVPSLDMRDNSIGDVFIAKGQFGMDLSDPEIRKSMCVHASSNAIIENGQAGFLIVPNVN